MEKLTTYSWNIEKPNFCVGVIKGVFPAGKFHMLDRALHFVLYNTITINAKLFKVQVSPTEGLVLPYFVLKVDHPTSNMKIPSNKLISIYTLITG